MAMCDLEALCIPLKGGTGTQDQGQESACGKQEPVALGSSSATDWEEQGTNSRYSKNAVGACAVDPEVRGMWQNHLVSSQ